MKVETLEKLPQVAHYAVLEFEAKTIFYEGDERSRTNPGHGYPSYTESINTVNYITFNSEDLIKEWIIKAEKLNKKYQLVRVEPIKTSIKADVTFS